MYTAYTENIVQLHSVIVKYMHKSSCKCKTGYFITPAFGFTSDFNIHHRHLIAEKKLRIVIFLMRSRPMCCLCNNMVFLKTENVLLLFIVSEKVVHISYINRPENTGVHISERMNRKHLVGRICTFVPCYHSRHIKVSEVFIHIRQIFIIVQTKCGICRYKIVLVSFFVNIFIHRHAVKKYICLFLKIAFLFEQLPNFGRYMSPVLVVANIVYCLH